jgi:hypothetical protein
VLQVLLPRRRVETGGHAAELAVEPASTRAHERVVARQLLEHELLQQRLNARLELQGVRNLVLKVAHRV